MLLSTHSDDDVDACISELVAVAGEPPGTLVHLGPTKIEGLCRRAARIFLAQPMLLELVGPINVVGDVHGQYYDLLRLFEMGGFPDDEQAYLFLGDYIDRGRQGIETISLLLAYKIKHQDTFFMLRGNHECPSLNRVYGFYDECKRRYTVKLWRTGNKCGLACTAFMILTLLLRLPVNDCLSCLPCAAVIGERMFCVHGGLSPELLRLEQILNISRPSDVPDEGLLCDFLWADPDPGMVGWGENARGVSYTFGADIVQNFLQKHDLDLVVRAHQVVDDGYEFFADRGLVTLFSAPNYCGEFDNAGAMMVIDEELVCSFKLLRPQ